MTSFVRFLSASLLLFHGSLFLANAADLDADTRPMWGVRAALDINIPGKWHGDAGCIDMFRRGAGVTAGVVCNVWLGSGFFLEPGVSLFYDTYSYKDLVIQNDMDFYESDPSLYKLGVRIPVVAGYTFNLTDRFSMDVFTGPELSYAFYGNVRMKDKSLIDGLGLALFGKEGSQRRIDCAWKVGVGFPMGLWSIGIDAAVGMTDLLKSGLTFRENRCTLSLSRYF